ncbi:hypothetical protein A4G19_12320 [Pasteurellaceae bacterium Macca]|nr:hypothetical protein [Pasteurellaceae bacterium Macca]
MEKARCNAKPPNKTRFNEYRYPHYLNRKARTATPLFTLRAFIAKCEPYPLAELLIVLNWRIEALKQAREESPHPSNDLITIHTLENQQARLNKDLPATRQLINSTPQNKARYSFTMMKNIGLFVLTLSN